jgi:hypothetical protein
MGDPVGIVAVGDVVFNDAHRGALRDSVQAAGMVAADASTFDAGGPANDVSPVVLTPTATLITRRWFPSGLASGTPAEALDCACGLYLNDATVWRPPTN